MEWNKNKKGKATSWWFRDRGIASEVAELVGIGIEVAGREVRVPLTVPGSGDRERSCGTCRDRYRSSGIGVEVAGREVRVPLTISPSGVSKMVSNRGMFSPTLGDVR